MTEEKKEPGDVSTSGDAARIAELERENEKLRKENRALRGKGKMLTTSTIEAPAMGSPRKNIMVLTTIAKPHPIGGRMLQTHGLPKPESPEAATAKILDRVKRDRAADTKKEKR